MTRTPLIFLAALVGLSTLSGCYTTTIVSGKPPSPATVANNARWHHGVMWGIGEVSGPYDLSQICPQGWAEIETETSFVNGFLASVTSSVYSPQTVTIRCSGAPEAVATGAAPTPRPAEQAAPAQSQPTFPTPPVAPAPTATAAGAPAEAAPATADEAPPPPPAQ